MEKVPSIRTGSPSPARRGGTGTSKKLDAMASAMARSAAGSRNYAEPSAGEGA